MISSLYETKPILLSPCAYYYFGRLGDNVLFLVMLTGERIWLGDYPSFFFSPSLFLIVRKIEGEEKGKKPRLLTCILCATFIIFSELMQIGKTPLFTIY